MCAGFRAGSGDAHQLFNPGPLDVVYLEVGDRSAGDSVSYPDDDLLAVWRDGRWQFTHKDGRPMIDRQRYRGRPAHAKRGMPA